MVMGSSSRLRGTAMHQSNRQSSRDTINCGREEETWSSQRHINTRCYCKRENNRQSGLQPLEMFPVGDEQLKHVTGHLSHRFVPKLDQQAKKKEDRITTGFQFDWLDVSERAQCARTSEETELSTQAAAVMKSPTSIVKPGRPRKKKRGEQDRTMVFNTS
ncbi:hypothetical protein EYF80_006708 [Liparis tanakae]|uniref:Uncharacterized protein n=1 Tax=Liparis tanakae TaxID=230148 RepID=A0A4Z2IZ83_9TELE|nr:hypothetical protein EYF80_006708 [Liparis tanakae]